MDLLINLSPTPSIGTLLIAGKVRHWVTQLHTEILTSGVAALWVIKRSVEMRFPIQKTFGWWFGAMTGVMLEVTTTITTPKLPLLPWMTFGTGTIWITHTVAGTTYRHCTSRRRVTCYSCHNLLHKVVLRINRLTATSGAGVGITWLGKCSNILLVCP